MNSNKVNREKIKSYIKPIPSKSSELKSFYGIAISIIVIVLVFVIITFHSHLQLTLLEENEINNQFIKNKIGSVEVSSFFLYL